MSVFKGSKPLPRGGVALEPPPLALPRPTGAATFPGPACSGAGAAPGPLRPLDPHRQLDLANPMRRLGCHLAVALIFVRFGMIHEILLQQLHFSTYLIPILGIPSGILMVASGGLRRVLQYRVSYYWIGLMVWLMLAVPFSYWRGGSSTLVFGYLRAGWAMDVSWLAG